MTFDINIESFIINTNSHFSPQFCGNYAVIFYAVDVFSGIGTDHVSVTLEEAKVFSFGNSSQLNNSTSVYSLGDF